MCVPGGFVSQETQHEQIYGLLVLWDLQPISPGAAIMTRHQGFVPAPVNSHKTKTTVPTELILW